MYSGLLLVHSFFRWLVLIALLASLIQAYRGFSCGKEFSKGDNALRHWTATIAHLQLVFGVLLYLKSPIIQYFWHNPSKSMFSLEFSFFSLIHFTLMILAVVLVTIGSALAKRKKTDRQKYKTMLIWFSITLSIIFIAIPWPFSPFINRPYFRAF